MTDPVNIDPIAIETRARALRAQAFREAVLALIARFRRAEPRPAASLRDA